jgi:hypothetical protein
VFVPQEFLMPTGWELIGRVVVVLGLAGILGLAGRQIAIWLRNRYRKRTK